MNPPLISVITVCRNAKNDLLATMESVFEQEIRDQIEWIIVDGNSSDGTRTLLQSLDEPWIKWVSESDKGIYDAMNKGLRMATGEWLWFLNAGDRFQKADSTINVKSVPDEVEIAFGEVLVVDDEYNAFGTRSDFTPHRLPDELRKEDFQFGMVVSHQAFIVRKRIAPFYNSKRYHLSGDLDWMLNILGQPRKSMNIGVLTCILRRGESIDRWPRSQFERFLILARHFGYLNAFLNHLFIIVRRFRHACQKGPWR